MMSTPMTTPRETPQYRSKSSRELYRPAIQDFSRQSKPPPSLTDDEVVFRFSVNGSVTPDTYASENGQVPDMFLPRYSRGSSSRQTALPPATPISLPPPKVAFYAENDYRHRIRLKAQNRYKLHPVKRTKHSGLDSCLSASSLGRGIKQTPRSTDVDSLRLDVTNRTQMSSGTDTYREKRLVSSRTPAKRHSPFCSLLKSSRQYTVEGYDHEPKKTYPVLKHRYSKWLTAGLKIQSLKIHDHRSNNGKNNVLKLSDTNDQNDANATEPDNLANGMNDGDNK